MVMDIQRDSRPASHELFANQEEKAALEARNGLLQFDEVLSLVDQARSGFKLRPSTIQRLQRRAYRTSTRAPGITAPDLSSLKAPRISLPRPMRWRNKPRRCANT